MSQNLNLAIAHFGICVSDLERSTHFYTEALGFVFDYYVDVGPPYDVLTELPGIKSRVGFFRRDGVRIELLSYENPAVTGSAERRPMNQLGLTHLALVVDDLDATAERILKFGGHVHTQTKVTSAMGELVFCTDPDGMRIELWERAG